MNNEGKGNNINNNEELFTDEFFSEINTLKKLNEKKSKIDSINNYLKENISNNNLPNNNNISKLYDYLLSNLNENNNNYVLSQLKLIETLITINNTTLNSSTKNFPNFAKNALPKLFDKY